MEWYQFLTVASAMFLMPYKALTEIYYRYKKQLFNFGFLASVMGNVSLILSGILMSHTGMFHGLGFIVSHTIFVLILNYAVLAVAVAIFKLILDFMGAQADIRELTGAYLVSEFPNVLLLPIALIFRVFPQPAWQFFPLFQFAILLLVVMLKAKAIALTSRLSEVKSFGILLIPLAFLVFLVSVTIIYGSIFIANALI